MISFVRSREDLEGKGSREEWISLSKNLCICKYAWQK